MAPTFSCVKGEILCFLENLGPEDMNVRQDKVCLRLLVLPEPRKEIVVLQYYRNICSMLNSSPYFTLQYFNFYATVKVISDRLKL